MRQRERIPDQAPDPQGEGQNPPGGMNLDALRAEVASFAARSQAVVRAQLSPNSQNFLNSAQQAGGQ